MQVPSLKISVQVISQLFPISLLVSFDRLSASIQSMSILLPEPHDSSGILTLFDPLESLLLLLHKLPSCRRDPLLPRSALILNRLLGTLMQALWA